MKAKLKYKMISPKKANLIAELIRGKKVQEALDILKFTPKKGAKILYKVVKSAAGNAENNFKQNIEDLYIKEIIVNQGPMHRRHVPISRGRTHPILKRTSHISVSVGVKEEKVAKKEESKKTETKEEPEKEATKS